MKKELYLGLDVHKDCILRATAEEGRRGEVRDSGAISNDLHAAEKWIARLRKAHGKEVLLPACYEAGPCGFGLARRLQQLGVACEVVAPSMTPTRTGARLAAAAILGHSDTQTNASMKKIIRISRAHFDPHKVDEVIALLLESRAVIWPKQEQLPGYVDGDLGIDRQNGSMLWITFWDTLEHAKALGSLPEMVESNARFKAGGLKFDPIITHEIL